MFMFFVGCDGGMGGIIGGGDNPQSLAGAKTLSRPAGYDFSEAVGEKASQYYYNIFAREILYNLYIVYEDKSYSSNLEISLLNGIDTTNGETFTNFTGSNQYYLYDSLRYTISDVTTTYNNDDSVNKQEITLDTNSGWNWTISDDATNKGIFFREIFYSAANGEGDTKQYIQNYVENNNGTITITFSTNFYERFSNWEELYFQLALESLMPSFMEYYSSTVSRNKDDSEVINYWESPYYQQVIEGETENLTAENYFQDALEYATYLFVLGYDYVEEDDQGNFTETDDAPLFDFEIQYNASGVVSDIRVNGWENQSISIVDALGRVQELYQEQAGFIGLTAKNKEQIARFIKDKVIGANAISKDLLTVTQKTIKLDENGVAGNIEAGTALNFNHNYQKIIENVINYACSQAPIGYDSETNQSLTLDNAYPVSKITDYSGDYFFLNYENDDDSELFKYIEAAEYQSLVLFPQSEDLGKPIEDLWLAFEYYENPDPSKQMAESITINVGFRYFSCSGNGGQGEIVCQGEFQKEIKFGKNGEVSGENPDVNWVYIGYSEKEQDQYDIALPSGLTINTEFNNNIGGGVLNPFVSGTVLEGDASASKLITGTDSTREYYKLNNSSTYGFYSTLDESKFSVNEAGEDACDFIEIYFDINKDKSTPNINYNYKVGIYYFGTQDV